MTDPTLTTPYCGRFAPTPSGPLHLGSLLTALASWLQARREGGRWLLRIDDLDRPRCVHGADTEILRQLEAHGLGWDGTPRYQSRHVNEYEDALAQLLRDGEVYPCTCTRARLLREARPGPDGPVYDGHCRARHLPCPQRHALRFRVAAGVAGFEDGWRGRQQRELDREVGDFVLRRSDGTIGYQLACAVDELEQGITEVVRGSDLLGSTFCQRLVMEALGATPPSYRHGPLLLGANGLKLSKQNHAAPIAAAQASANLQRCLEHLGLAPPAELQAAPPRELLAWALERWPPAALLRLAQPSGMMHCS